ncbi:MAG: hypothetical protein PHP28_13045 [Actinomycetota bacterium]|nr:hypothetical protein [Actinomycetota bacterium]MDD5666092.1 hypothetical protein [Actinomycetota bacterium]
MPLLIGTNADEGVYFVPEGLTQQQYELSVKHLYGEYADEVLGLVPTATPEEADAAGQNPRLSPMRKTL